MRSTFKRRKYRNDAGRRKAQFRIVYDDHYDALWRYCLRRSATFVEAEETLNETFAIAWRKFDSLPSGVEARYYLYGVARNQLRSRWRKNKRDHRLQQRLVNQRSTTTSLDVSDLGDSSVEPIFIALAALKESDQELLRLAVWEELPHANIAAMLGCSENAVNIRLHRARKRLAKKLERQGEAVPRYTSPLQSARYVARKAAKNQGVTDSTYSHALDNLSTPLGKRP